MCPAVQSALVTPHHRTGPVGAQQSNECHTVIVLNFVHVSGCLLVSAHNISFYKRLSETVHVIHAVTDTGTALSDLPNCGF